jgi:hypothetical protein
MKEILQTFVVKCFLASLLGVSADICQRSLVDRNYLNLDGDAQQIRKWSQCMGRFVRHHPVTVTSSGATAQSFM